MIRVGVTSMCSIVKKKVITVTILYISTEIINMYCTYITFLTCTYEYVQAWYSIRRPGVRQLRTCRGLQVFEGPGHGPGQQDLHHQIRKKLQVR